MKKRWIDSNGNFWNGTYIVLNDTQIFNPSDEQMVEAGYTEYIIPPSPEPTPEELLLEAKKDKKGEIDLYDCSTNVNSFSLNGHNMWLTVEERQQIATQISANEAVGRETMTRWFNEQSFTFPIVTWKQMLMAVEVYAGDALNVTESHKAAVDALTTIEAVEAYNYTVGYPEKLAF